MKSIEKIGNSVLPTTIYPHFYYLSLSSTFTLEWKKSRRDRSEITNASMAGNPLYQY